MKKFSLAALAGFIVMFLLSGLWYMVLMADFYRDNPGIAGNVQRGEPMLWLIGLGYLFLAMVMAYLYPKGVEGTSKIMQGLKFGAIVGFLWATPLNLVLYGSLEISTKVVVIVDGLWHIVEGAIGGLVIALVYGLPKKSG